MVRRAAAGVILGVSLFVASLAWSAFIALQTVFDPGRSQQIADDLWDDPAVRNQLADNIAGAMNGLIPAEVEVSDDAIDTAARNVLNSPALRDVVDTAFVQTHAAFLGEADLPRAIEVGAVSQTVRVALVAADPRLDTVLPAAPDVTIELPTDRIPDAGPVRRALQFVVPIFAFSAAAGIAVALLTTTNRPAVLRRAGIWALTATSIVLVIAYGIPWLIETLAPAQAEVVTAFVRALLSAAVTPALVLGGLGVVAVVLSLAWRAGSAVAREREPGAPPRRADDPVEPAWEPRPVSPVPPAPVVETQPAPQPAPAQTAPIAAPSVPPAPAPAPAPVQLQQLMAEPEPTVPGPSSPAPAQPTVAPKWIPGIGWVQHPDDERPPEGARWEPGVGYILDRPADPLED